MNIDKLTNKSREALINSRQIALELHHNELRALHLLAALLADENGLVPSVFEKCGVNREVFNTALKTALAGLPKLEGNHGSDVYNSREFSELLTDGAKHAENMKDEYISVEHLLLAIFNSGNRAKELLENSGVTSDRVLQALQSIRGNQRVTSVDPEARSFRAAPKTTRCLSVNRASAKPPSSKDSPAGSCAVMSRKISKAAA